MFTTEVFKPNPDDFGKIKDTIISLESGGFGDKSFTSQQISEDFLNKNNTIILLKETRTDAIVGFTYAKPIEEAEANRVSEKGETAYIWDTVIKKEHWGKRLVGVLVERCAVITNNYAENVLKNYEDRIVKTYPLDSAYGPQIFFRIKL